MVPSPNAQYHEVTFPVERSVNETVSGEGPDVLSAVKSVTGSGGESRLIYLLFVVDALPAELLTLRETV